MLRRAERTGKLPANRTGGIRQRIPSQYGRQPFFTLGRYNQENTLASASPQLPSLELAETDQSFLFADLSFLRLTRQRIGWQKRK